MDKFFPPGNGPLTPSHHPEYQKANPIKADAEFIVMFHTEYGYDEKNETVLKNIFNRHSKPQDAVQPSARPIPYTEGFVIKGVSWPIINELRANPRVDSFGPNHKIGPA